MSKVTEHIKTLKDLLMFDGFPVSYIQGHHTRIVMNSDGIFSTIQKKGNNSSIYTTILYTGDKEELAVKTYLESEEE